MNLELHKKLALTAKKLIEQHGRTVTIIKNSETFDSETPWISTQTPHENGMSLQLKGVFVNPKSLNSYGFSNEILQNNSSQNGSLIKQKKYLLVAEDSVQEAYQNYLESVLEPEQGLDLTEFDTVIDGEQYLKIVYYEVLKPGEKTIFHFFILE